MVKKPLLKTNRRVALYKLKIVIKKKRVNNMNKFKMRSISMLHRVEVESVRLLEFLNFVLSSLLPVQRGDYQRYQSARGGQGGGAQQNQLARSHEQQRLPPRGLLYGIWYHDHLRVWNYLRPLARLIRQLKLIF